MPGSSVTVVARRHRICSSLIYRWRRELLGTSGERSASSFVPVEVVPSSAPHPAGPVPGIVEVVAQSGHVVRLTPPIDARVLKAVLAGIA